MRSSQSCGSYIRCTNGRGLELECHAPFVFNVRTARCDHADRVDCGECSRYGVQNLADPGGECRRFVRCVRGFSEMRRCPAGLSFDRRIGDCNHADDVPCRLVAGADDEEDTVCAAFERRGVVKIGDRDNCRRYFICTNGVKQEQMCPKNTYYDTATGECVTFPSGCQRRDGPLVVAMPPTVAPPIAEVRLPDCQQYIGQGLVFVNAVGDCRRFVGA